MARATKRRHRVEGATIRAAREELLAANGDDGRDHHDLVAELAAQADGWFTALGADLDKRWALVATGGYGAGRLSPGSDLDVVLLHPPRTSSKEVKRAAELIWYPIWDAGLTLNPATNSPKGLLALASDDLETATSLLGLRHLAGDPSVTAHVAQRAAEQWRQRPQAWLRRLLASARQRWGRFGEVSSLLEPNLKDGRGGLRDADVLAWAVATDGDDVAGCLEAPLGELTEPVALLTRVRAELHLATGRSTDVLLLQDQDAVAAACGTDADALMRDVAAAARTIDWTSERFWRRVERLLDPPRWPGHHSPVLAEPVDDAVVSGDELHLAPAADLDDPSLVFRVADAAARNDIPISREALTELATDGVADPPTPWSRRTREAFVSLLGTGEPMVPTVEALERYGLFSRYLPEWAHVRSLPQRNAFHTYNVDRHLLRTVANGAELLRKVSRPDLLLLAALMHDIGKGYPRDHTEVGIELAAEIMPRIGFGSDDTATVIALVEHHLLLAETATRRNLADPRTAANIADALGSEERLDLLRALTEADSVATGPAAWSSWKESLIDQLTRAVGRLFNGHATSTPARDEERSNAVVEEVRAGTSVAVAGQRDGELERVQVATGDRRGLFATVAGVLATHRLDVMSAEAWTSHDGVAVDEFEILSRDGAPLPLEAIRRELADVFAGRLDIDARVAARIRAAESGYRRPQAAAPPRTEVYVSNEASDSTTVVDIRVPDGPAVLYRLSRALTDRGVEIRTAKVATLGHEVVDVFYVQHPGAPPRQLSGDELTELRRSLLQWLEETMA